MLAFHGQFLGEGPLSVYSCSPTSSCSRAQNSNSRACRAHASRWELGIPACPAIRAPFLHLEAATSQACFRVKGTAVTLGSCPPNALRKPLCALDP